MKDKILEFIGKKSVGFYCAIAAVILNLIGCILYGVSRENVNALVIVFLAIATAVSIVVAIKPFKYIEFISFGLSAAAVGITLYLLLGNIAEIMFKNNVIGLSATFIPAFVFIVLGGVSAALAAILKQEKE